MTPSQGSTSPTALPPLDRFLHLLLVLAVPLALLTLAVRVVATGFVMRFEYSAAGIPPPTWMSLDERDAAADATRRYVIGLAERAEVETLLWDDAPLYAPSELKHLDDVRGLFRRLWFVGLAAWAFVLITARIPPLRRRIDGARAIARGGAMTAIGVLLLGGAILLSFDTVFTRFHQLLFAPGTWTFAVDSGLISLFPERFWRDAAIAIAVLLLLEGLWFWGLYRRAANR